MSKSQKPYMVKLSVYTGSEANPTEHTLKIVVSATEKNYYSLASIVQDSAHALAEQIVGILEGKNE